MCEKCKLFGTFYCNSKSCSKYRNGQDYADEIGGYSNVKPELNYVDTDNVSQLNRNIVSALLRKDYIKKVLIARSVKLKSIHDEIHSLELVKKTLTNSMYEIDRQINELRKQELNLEFELQPTKQGNN